MILIINAVNYNESSVPDGSLIGVFDGEKCVGRGEIPLEDGILKVSKDDGTGNGFTQGNEIYFRVWNHNTGTILTA